MSFVGDLIGEITGANKAAEAMRQGSAQAAGATTEATEKNIEFQKWLWGEQKALAEPYAEAGREFLPLYDQLTTTPTDDLQLDELGELDRLELDPFSYSIEDLYLDPGYEFRKREGQKAYETSGAARGMQLSGPQAKALTRYGQDFASGEYGKAYGRAVGEHQMESTRRLAEHEAERQRRLTEYQTEAGRRTAEYESRQSARQRSLDNLYRMIAGGQAAAAGQAQTGGTMGANISSSIMTGGQALSNMYQQQAQATASQAMSPWSTIMDIGRLGVAGYGAHRMGA